MNILKKQISRGTQAVLILLLIGYLILAMMQTPSLEGESGSFTLLTVSLVETGDFVISEEDYQKAVQLFPSHETYLDWYYHDFLPRDEHGNAYPWYFGIYSFLCIPLFLILRLFQFDSIYSFAITNALLLSAALYLVYKECKLKDDQRLLLILFLGFSPIVQYINWQSYEVATYAFVICAMVYWFTERRKRAALFLSIAGTMNPTAMAFGVFMILEFFFARFQENKWKIHKFIMSCLCDWKQILEYAACFTPCLVPIGITYMFFHRFNMVAMLGVTDVAGIVTRVLAYLFDLNLGFLPYIPIFLFLTVVVAFFAFKKKEWKYVFAFMGIVATIAGYSITSHINCGMTGIARYNVWTFPMITIMIFYALEKKIIFSEKRLVIFTEISSLVWCTAIIAVVAFSPYKGEYIYWSPMAEIVLEYMPQLYNPLPSTFNSRTKHIDGGYDISEPVFYIGKDGYVRKILIPTDCEYNVRDKLLVNAEDQELFEREYRKIDISNSNYCYLNFPNGTEILYAEAYGIGDEILFTDANNGTRYFIDGISVIEEDFAWSNGKESIFRAKVENVQHDLNAIFNFKTVYGGKQTLIVTSQGQELFNQELTDETTQISFTIPSELIENGLIELEFSYPDAVDLIISSNGSDNRVVALAWKRVLFTD